MQRPFTLLAAGALLLPMAGCTVRSRTGDRGDKDVAIATPLGGLSVKTDGDAVQRKLGLPLYPGATLEKKQGKDEGAADVNMDFGAFHLRVLAMSFSTTDRPEQVREFYRKALSQYSDVIECRNKQPVGKPEKTGLGLSCADSNHVHAGDDAKRDSSAETELKAGSSSRQHIVSFSRAVTGRGLAWSRWNCPGASNPGHSCTAGCGCKTFCGSLKAACF